MLILKFIFKAFFSLLVFISEGYAYWEIEESYAMSNYKKMGKSGDLFSIGKYIGVITCNGGYSTPEYIFAKTGNVDLKEKARVPIKDGGFSISYEGNYSFKFVPKKISKLL